MDINATVWSVRYAIPYQAANLYEIIKFIIWHYITTGKIGQALRDINDLDSTNRSNAALIKVNGGRLRGLTVEEHFIFQNNSQCQILTFLITSFSFLLT